MRRRLRAMENDGRLVFTKRKRYALPGKLDYSKALDLCGHREGYGFYKSKAKEDLFIPNHQMQRVMHGDFVLAQPAGLDRRGRLKSVLFVYLKVAKTNCRPFLLRKWFLAMLVPDDSRIDEIF